TGARIEHDLHARSGKLAPRSISDPRVLANLETEAHPANVEHQVAHRYPISQELDLAHLAFGPGRGPARPVMQALPRRVTLGRDTDEAPVHQERGSIDDHAIDVERQAHGDHQTARFGQERTTHVARAPARVWPQER